MDFGPMLYLRAERIDRLHRLVVIRVRGPVQLLFRAEAPNEAGVPLDAVVHDGGPLGDVSSVGLDAFPFGYVAPPRDEGEPVAFGVHAARNHGLVARNAPQPEAAGLPIEHALVDGHELLVNPHFPRQHRAFLDLEGDGADLHPPYVGGAAGYADGVAYRLELAAVDHHVDHQPELVGGKLLRRHDGRRRPRERPPASVAEETRRPVRLDVRRAAPRALQFGVHEKTPSEAKVAIGEGVLLDKPFRWLPLPFI